jgi:hypothetical protein
VYNSRLAGFTYARRCFSLLAYQGLQASVLQELLQSVDFNFRVTYRSSAIFPLRKLFDPERQGERTRRCDEDCEQDGDHSQVVCKTTDGQIPHFGEQGYR